MVPFPSFGNACHRGPRRFWSEDLHHSSGQRQAAKGEFRANIHQGGEASVIKITAEERKLAIKAAKTLNLAVAEVDII